MKVNKVIEIVFTEPSDYQITNALQYLGAPYHTGLISDIGAGIVITEDTYDALIQDLEISAHDGSALASELLGKLEPHRNTQPEYIAKPDIDEADLDYSEICTQCGQHFRECACELDNAYKDDYSETRMEQDYSVDARDLQDDDSCQYCGKSINQGHCKCEDRY